MTLVPEVLLGVREFLAGQLGDIGVHRGKCVNTRVPSSPSHRKEWCGNGFVVFHEIFWVRNQREPESFTSCGSAAE